MASGYVAPKGEYKWWVGQDGNAWANIEGQGVVNFGTAKNIPGGVLESSRRIDDPVNGGGSSGGGSGGGGGDSNPLNQAAIDATKKTLGSLDTELDTGYGNINRDYSSLISDYDRERKQNRADYDEQTVTNNQSLTKNKQNALLAGTQGRRGLRGVLASLGALGGTGEFLADRAVQTGVNQDVGEASETFAGNARGLDKAWDRFDEEDDERRADAEAAKETNRTALEGRIAAKRQEIFQKLAELFGEADNIPEARNYLSKAGDLSDVIARKTRVEASPFTKRSAAFTPGDLESYLAGAGDMTVKTGSGAPGGNQSSLLFGRFNRRDREEERQVA